MSTNLYSAVASKEPSDQPMNRGKHASDRRRLFSPGTPSSRGAGEERRGRLLTVSKNLAILAYVLLSGVTLLLGVAASGGEASAMPVPGLLTWDTAIMGVIEKLPEATPQGDTHVVIQQGNPIPIQSDVLDLSKYVGEEVTVYIRTLPGTGGNKIFDVLDVGPPQSFSAAKA